MILALDGSSADGLAYTDVVNLAAHAPAWLDDAVSAWSTYGLAPFVALMTIGWWRAGGAGRHRVGDRRSPCRSSWSRPARWTRR